LSQRNEVEGQNAVLRLPFSFTAGAPYAPSERPVCSLNVWDCANVSWSDLESEESIEVK